MREESQLNIRHGPGGAFLYDMRAAIKANEKAP